MSNTGNATASGGGGGGQGGGLLPGIQLGALFNVGTEFLRDYNRRLVGAGGTGSLKYYDSTYTQEKLAQKDRLGKAERRAVEQDAKVIKLLNIKRAHDIKGRIPKMMWGEGEYAVEEQYVSNVRVETAIRAIHIMLQDFETYCPLAIAGPTLMFWRSISAVPPWEKRCMLLAGRAGVIPAMANHLKARGRAFVDASKGSVGKLTVSTDDGGIKVVFRFERAGSWGRDDVEVYLVFKDGSEDRFAPSKLCGISDDKAKSVKLRDADLRRESFFRANLGSTAVVNCPRNFTKSINRWYYDAKRKGPNVPDVVAPFPWVWSKENARYVRTSGPTYYLKPPYGKKTLIFALAVILFVGLLFIMWKGALYLRDRQKRDHPSPTLLVHQPPS